MSNRSTTAAPQNESDDLKSYYEKLDKKILNTVYYLPCLFSYSAIDLRELQHHTAASLPLSSGDNPQLRQSWCGSPRLTAPHGQLPSNKARIRSVVSNTKATWSPILPTGPSHNRNDCHLNSTGEGP